jgi:viroplasmin and RNaseH domain-containing protein
MINPNYSPLKCKKNMDYSLSQVASIADCDLLLSNSAKEKKDLEFRKLQQERSYGSLSSGTTDVEMELLAVTSEIGAVEAVAATLPPGQLKDDYERDLVKLRFKKFTIEERRERYGIIGMLEKEYELNCIDKELAENQAYTTAVNERKAEL